MWLHFTVTNHFLYIHFVLTCEYPSLFHKECGCGHVKSVSTKYLFTSNFLKRKSTFVVINIYKITICVNESYCIACGCHTYD
jgi:hypothetical protein